MTLLDVYRLEAKYKLLYLLCDLGVKDAHIEAKEAWNDYVMVIMGSISHT